jgi:hypothetical protein
VPRRDQLTRRAAIESIQDELEVPELVLARFHTLVHDRSSSAGRCPCCDSDCSRVVEDLPEFELLIDTVEGTRYLRHTWPDPAEFDDLAAEALVIDVPMRVAIDHLEILHASDDARVNALLGGARSAKTHLLCTCGLRRWGLRGGPNRTGWMLGPELDRAFLLVEKWALGEGDAPPICPPELMVSWPTELEQLKHDPSWMMIDGFKWTARHLGRQGKNLSGRNIEIVLWTEAATTASEVNFTRARGRIVQSKGAMWLDAVPEARNWVSTSVIEPAKAEAEERKTGKTRGRPTYRVDRLSITQNCWVDLEEAEAFRRDLHRIDPRMAAREADGRWVADRELCFEYRDGFHSFDPIDPDLDSLKFLGLEDVTELVVGTYFREPHTHLIAGDINAQPHTSLVSRFGVRPGMAKHIPDNWHVVFVDLLQTYNADSDQAAQELARYRGGRYKGAAFLIDATSMIARHNSGGTLNARRHILAPEAFQRAGFEVRGPMRQKRRTDDFADPTRYDGTLLQRQLMRADPCRFHIDRRFCQPYINSLQKQEAEADGVTPVKVSNTLQDRVVGAFTDCARYTLWPFFSLNSDARSGKPLNAIVYG